MTVLSSHEVEQAAPADSIVGPGERLRKERESQGLEQVRVAAQLHLSETMIEALEWDDFTALPEAVFTQGYLRNYARLLGLPEGEILAAYQRLCPKDARTSVSTKRSVQIKQEVRSSHGLVQLATWLIVIGLIALLFLWWQGRFGWQDVSVEDFIPETEVFDDPSTGQDLSPQMPDVTSSAEGFEAVPADSGDEAQLLSVPQSGQPLTETESIPDSAPLTTSFGADVAEEQPTVEAAPEVAQGLQSTPEPKPATGRLVLEFAGNCWAEVRDATGRAHIIGEKRAGARYVLATDLGPFKIILGDASVVSMVLNGEPYDLAPHTW